VTVGFLDALLGRSKQAKPDLDALFALPSAAVTLEASAGFKPIGRGSVCFRAVEGRAFDDVENEVQELLNAGDGPKVQLSNDEYGYTWLRTERPPEQVPDLVTDLHAVNSTLESAGFGPSLLCSLVSFADDRGRRLALVYLYKRGTFYPFAPQTGEKRDSPLELQIRGLISSDLPIEDDLQRWFPVWGAPGL
jgi:hypothetical protein